VNPIIFQETELGTAVADITITGQAFASEVLVQVGTYTMPSGNVTVNGATSIDVENLPDAGTLGIFFSTSPCIAPGNLPGAQSSATPLSVGVTNFPGACIDTLVGAMVIEPTASVCTPLSMAVAPLALVFGAVEGSLNFTVTNDGPADFQWSAALTDPDGVFAITTPASGTLGPGGVAQVTVQFTYAAATAAHNGSVTISSNPAGIVGSPAIVTLTATTP
jgi:hypothetical protein